MVCNAFRSGVGAGSWSAGEQGCHDRCFGVTARDGPLKLPSPHSVAASRPAKQEEVRVMSLTTATDELRGRFGAEVILPNAAG
jgi:hypothetical protein